MKITITDLQLFAIVLYSSVAALIVFHYVILSYRDAKKKIDKQIKS